MRHNWNKKGVVDGYISIHAPAKGATYEVIDARYRAKISIHAPAKGATLIWARLSLLQKISIHAPAKGATNKLIIPTINLPNFNPRTREGCDIVIMILLKNCKKFQSTHPRRVRLNLLKKKLIIFVNFNPRTREGCDDISLKDFLKK